MMRGDDMYYDYPDEEFYPGNEYQEQIDMLKEAVRNSVKSEILEEMNRLRAENEKLQGIKEHFEEVKRDYEKKKAECERIAYYARDNANSARLAELMKSCKVLKWKVDWKYVYGPKCQKCDDKREIPVALPSGRIAKDKCECDTESKRFYYPEMYILTEFTDRFESKPIVAYYTQHTVSRSRDVYYKVYGYSICDKLTEEKKKTAIKELNDDVQNVLFDTEEGCQEVCNRLNQSLGDYMYTVKGEDIREIIKGEKPDES